MYFTLVFTIVKYPVSVPNKAVFFTQLNCINYSKQRVQIEL